MWIIRSLSSFFTRLPSNCCTAAWADSLYSLMIWPCPMRRSAMATRWRGLKGFPIYASAPLSMPSIWFSSELRAESRMNGMWRVAGLSFTALRSWFPSIPSIITSLMMSTGCRLDICFRASSPLLASITLNRERNRLQMKSRMSGLSSTTRISLLKTVPGVSSSSNGAAETSASGSSFTVSAI